jgi:hypothetical protein
MTRIDGQFAERIDRRYRLNQSAWLLMRGVRLGMDFWSFLSYDSVRLWLRIADNHGIESMPRLPAGVAANLLHQVAA